MSNAIATENQLTGTTAWLTTKKATTQIAGYCDHVSYNASDVVTLFVSTQVASTTYTINIYRLGWYGGTGACLKQQATGQVGVAQGYWDGATLNNCPTAISDSTTHNLEAGWASSYTWTIPSNACTGIYLVQLQDASGFQAYTSFVVKAATAGDYAYVRPITTDTAYNDWGGYSLYTNPNVGVKVSFNRPITYANGNGVDGLFQFEIGLIKWLERQGYNISYLADVDCYANASQLLNYKAMIFAGHSEYWAKEMRDGVEAAIAGGVGAAFVGANASYWQVRFGADNVGNANRCITCYKVKTTDNNLALDPLYGVDNSRVTSQWRDVPNRPEAKVIGIQYSSFLSTANLPMVIDASPDTTFLGATGLVAGQIICVDAVGHEFDRVWAGISPSNVKIIATTPLTDYQSLSDHHNMTFYVAPSGAPVFAAGTFGFGQQLDTYRWTLPATGPLAVPQIQQLFTNVMAELVRNMTTKVFSVFAIRR